MKKHPLYPNLFTPGKIGNITIKNRIVHGPHELEASGFNGEMTDDYIDYYERSARGGTGLIITAYASVDEEFSPSFAGCQLKVTDPRQVAMLSKLARRVHKYGAKILVQCYMAGRQAIPTAITGKRIVAPSAIGFGLGSEHTHDQIPEEITHKEIKEAVQKFVKAAKLLETAEIDGIEVLAAGGYLINEFLSPYTNKRTDEYGGSFENRTRFAREVMDGIHEAVGPDFIVGVRMCANEFMDEGYDLEEGARIAQFFESCGVDYINLNNGNQEKAYLNMDPIGFKTGWKSYITRKIKSSVSVPVFSTNVIKKPEQAEGFLAEGLMDFAVMTRGFIADTDWAKKAYECRSDEIKPCIGCLNCTDNTNIFKRCACAVNPVLLRQDEFPEPARDMEGRKVIVIGAGPSGLEAAFVMKKRGADVTVYEKKDRIGGAAELGARTPDKVPLIMLMDWYRTMIDKLGVDVRLGTEVSAQDIIAQKPYAVFVASGSDPRELPEMPFDGETVLNLEDVLENRMRFDGEKVVVIGGGMNACELAEYAGSVGGDVTLAYRGKVLAKKLQRDLLVTVFENYEKYGVKKLLGYRPLGKDETGVVVQNVETGEKLHLDADKVIVCIGDEPKRGLYEELSEVLDNVILTGDADKTGRIANAVRTGFERAYILE